MHTKLKLLAAACALSALSSAALADTWTLDYRHRYEDQTKYNYDRICVTGQFETGIGFYIDSSFKSGSSGDERTEDPEQWGDFTSNATEMSLWWNYSIEGTGFVLQPGIITESTSETTGYKPYFRVQYNFDNGFWLALRPRFDYWRYDDDRQDQKTGRVDLYLGYKYQQWDFMYQGTYMWALNDDADGHDRKMWDEEPYNFEHEFTVGYRIGNWRPYVQVANLCGKNGSTNGDRQTRLAVGVSYTF